MSPELTQLLPYILIGLLVGFVVVWLIARANRKTTIIGDETSGDVLDEGAARAASAATPCANWSRARDLVTTTTSLLA